MPRVTVIIPNYNGKKYIDDCLRSLKKQTFKDFDVIVVDNGSTDGSKEFVRDKWCAENPAANSAETLAAGNMTGSSTGIAGNLADRKKAAHFKVELIALPENTGFANAVNVGIEASANVNGKGQPSEYIFLLNNDAFCDEAAIERLVHVMDKKKKLFSAQAKMLQTKEPHNIDDCGDLYCALGWAFTPGKDADNKRFNRRESITSACAGAAIYRREYFDEVGLFDKEHFCYLEDVDIGYRARLKGYANVCEPAAIVYHAGSATSGSRYNAFKVELTAANNLFLIYKNMPALQILLNLPLILIGILVKHAFYTRHGLGIAHIKGLRNGLKKIAQFPDHRVKFGGRELFFALRLQIELWVNCARRALSV
ncbi:MAG: glycosyltransferase family 2 protein [Butyrivibrio sp.]|nr:glycosyltransferase family 2 protein [Butyrivibrio sp.]MBR1641533.1 glycosyltransferase family 2 protein [Butyrivibrio sp.]